MKRKCSRMWALSLLGLASCATLSLTLHGSSLANADHRQPALRPLPEIAVPNISEVKTILRLQRLLPEIARPDAKQPDAVDLRLFGYREVEKVVQPAIGEEKPGADPMVYDLTFAFFSDRRRFCIINNTIYTEGKDLPDGARILRIESRRVLLDHNGRKEWIFMEDGLHTVPEALN